MCSRTGTATLYGRLATSAVGRRARQLRDAQRVGVHQREAVRRAPACRAATVAGSAAASTSSISTAVTRSAASSSARVSEPRPGPTSSTTSSGRTSAVRTIRRTVLASMTKFWPRCLVGGRPARRPARGCRRGPAGRREHLWCSPGKPTAATRPGSSPPWIRRASSPGTSARTPGRPAGGRCRRGSARCGSNWYSPPCRPGGVDRAGRPPDSQGARPASSARRCPGPCGAWGGYPPTPLGRRAALSPLTAGCAAGRRPR